MKIYAFHGAGMNKTVWQGLSGVEALSFPAHDTTDEPLLPTIEKMAVWIKSQITQNEPVVLIGHSMGALAVLEAADHPRVAGIVLLGAAATMPVHPNLLTLAEENPSGAADMILKWGLSPSGAQQNTNKEQLKALMSTVNPKAIYNDLNACNIYTAGAATAAKINKPTLVITGSDDKLTKNSDGKALAAMIAGAKYHDMAGVGHMMVVEDALLTHRQINEFILEFAR